MAHSSDLAPFAHVGTGEANTLKFCYCTPRHWCERGSQLQENKQTASIHRRNTPDPLPKKSVKAQLPALHFSSPGSG